MAEIFMRVLNPNTALETLLYVFKNQMNLGRKKLCVVISSLDGMMDWSVGSIDTVFKSDILQSTRQGDLIILEHYNIQPINIFHYKEPNDLYSLIDLSNEIETCSHFFNPKNNSISFIFKNCPMARYQIAGNEIISEKIYGKKADIMNNIVGRISNGIFSTMKI